MRKYLAFAIVFICLIGLVGCNPSETAVTDENAPIETLPQEIEVTNAIGETAKLSEEDAEIILEILENGEWYEYPSLCAEDCRLVMGDNSLPYHSKCGTFNDDMGSLSVDDETQQLINSILEKYVTLGQYPV